MNSLISHRLCDFSKSPDISYGFSSLKVTRFNSIRKRYDKNKKAFYEVQVCVKGARLAYKCFDSQEGAKKWHEEQKEKWETHPLSFFKRKNSKRTFRDVLDLYKKQKFPLLALSTQQSMGVRTGRYIYLSESPFAQVKMSDFRAEHIDLLLDWLKEHPKVDHGKRKNFVQELKILGHVWVSGVSCPCKRKKT